MTITFNTPVTQNALTSKKLMTFSASIVERRIVVSFHVGYVNGGGEFVKVKEEHRLFTDDTTPSFANFLAACPAAQQLRRQTEQFEVTLDRPGTVD